MFSGQLSDVIGRRWTLVTALAVSFAAITIEFVATTNEVFFAGKFVNGFAVGTIQATSGTYIGEVCILLHDFTLQLLTMLIDCSTGPSWTRNLLDCTIIHSWTIHSITHR